MNGKFIKTIFISILVLFFNLDCSMPEKERKNFKVQVDRFADLEILRYQVPGFEDLSLRQKKFVYYLSEAALSGRDIIYDQNYKYNLLIRKTIYNIVKNYNGANNKNEESYDPVQWKQFMNYAKRVWFSNGIHHHYSTIKIIPEFERSYFKELIYNSNGTFPLNARESLDEFSQRIIPIIFDPNMLENQLRLRVGDLEKNNDKTKPIFEISSKTFDTQNTLYKYTDFQWKISGTKEEVIRENQKTIDLLEKDYPGISSKLFPLQLWKPTIGTFDDIQKKLSLLKKT